MTHEIDVEKQLTVLLDERGSSVPPPDDAWDRLEARLSASLPDVGVDQPIAEWGFTPDEEWSFPLEDESEDARSSRRWPVALTSAAAAAVVILVLIFSRGAESTQQQQIFTDDIEQPTVTTPRPTTPSTVADPVVLPSVVDPVSGYRWSRVATDDEAVFGQQVEEGMYSVLVGGPGLVAVGSGVWTSVDGITWSRVPDNDEIFAADVGERAVMTSITAGGPGLVAVGCCGGADGRPFAGGMVWTSIDGISWSRIPWDEAIFGGTSITSVTAGGPGLVAVGWDGHPHGGESNAVVWTSVDGMAWSRIPHDEAIFGTVTGAWMWSVAAGGPGLVAVGSTTDGAAVWTSVDGIAWSRVPHDEAVFGNAEMRSVTVGGPGLVAVGEAFGAIDSPAVWTSVDGLTWSRVPHDEAVFGNAGMSSVTAGGPGLVAVGFDGHPHGLDDEAAVWTSVDGIAWSRVPHDEAVFGSQPPVEMRSIIAGGPGLVAVGASSMDNPNNTGDVALWVAELEN